MSPSEKPSTCLSVEQVIPALHSKSARSRVLLHVCCAPCATSVLEYLSVHFNLTLLFYNPNIMPLDEYNKRAFGLTQMLLKTMTDEFILNGAKRPELIVSEYFGDDFKEIFKKYPNEPESKKRCRECFRLRLSHTARLAIKGEFDYFTTTLSVSPHKNASVINEVGCEVADEFGSDGSKVQFLCADFKKRNGYVRSVELSKLLGLYRQNYCGCSVK